MGLQDLFIAASVSVLKVLLVTALGSFLATNRVNILGEDARKHLNNVIFFVFSPALVGSNLATTITYESMISLWFMPFDIFLTFIIGSLLGWLVIQFTKPPQDLRGLVIVCCSAGNLGYMLLIILPVVCKEKGSPFGAPNMCQAYGIAYASLSMAIGAIFLWSYVYNIIRLSSSSNAVDFNIGESSSSITSREPLLCNKISVADVDLIVPEVDTGRTVLPCTFSGRTSKEHILMLLRKINLKALFAPPTIAAMVGFVVVLVPPIRDSMVGGEAPLRVIMDSVTLLGDGAIPALSLIMGGNLLSGMRETGVGKSLVIGIIAARYIALPFFGVLIVKAAFHFGLVRLNPLYQFILLLQFAVPPAMNIGTITQLFGAGHSECSVIMLWTYSLASVSLTLWLVSS